MNKIIFNLAFFCLLFLFLDIYFWQAYKNNFLFTVKETPLLKWAYWIVSFTAIPLMVYAMINYQNPESPKFLIVVRAFIISFYLAKLIACIPLLIDDVIRVFRWLYALFTKATSTNVTTSGTSISRLSFLRNLSFLVGAFFMGLMSWGIVVGRFNFKKHKLDIKLNKWPSALNGLKIIQISDLHLGSFTSTKPIEDVVEMINQEKPDLIVFTGDLVNNHYWEADDFIPHLAKLQAKYGKYSILGNHDYGDYLGLNKKSDEGFAEWNSNLQNMHKTHKKMGFDLLLNENRQLQIKGESFNLIGMENWGAGGFSKYGDFDKAINGLEDQKCSILLSHDPSHWEHQVLKHPFPIELQLSGHTHGMQFGVELGSFKWSPIQLKYPQWAGLYQNKNQNIYVNRGLGHLGYAGRVGIHPEISILKIYNQA